MVGKIQLLQRPCSNVEHLNVKKTSSELRQFTQYPVTHLGMRYQGPIIPSFPNTPCAPPQTPLWLSNKPHVPEVVHAATQEQQSLLWCWHLPFQLQSSLHCMATGGQISLHTHEQNSTCVLSASVCMYALTSSTNSRKQR
jgi:hypothetical protein